MSLLLQALAHEGAPVTDRKVRQLAKHLVAVLSVELGSLKAEGVKVGIVAATLPGLLFCRTQEWVPPTLAAESLLQPEQVQVQPTPMRRAD